MKFNYENETRAFKTTLRNIERNSLDPSSKTFSKLVRKK